jgi:signal transduction histidine kinase
MDAKGRMALWNMGSQSIRSPVRRYGFSVLSVAIALGLALVSQAYDFRDGEAPLFNLAVAVTSWYAGVGASVLAVVLSTACFSYFFTAPLYSLEISHQDLPYFLLLTAWAIVIAWFVSARRRIEDDLRRTGDHLRIEVEQRKQREGEIRKLNRELARRAQELQTSNRDLESFAYSVSHDLRAPLRHVAGYAELLQKQASSLLDEKSHRYMRTIIESAKRMGDLIDDLLAFSRIGRAETQMRTINLEQLVREVVAEIGQDLGEREIAWKINALPVCHGDGAMVKLVLHNLISNAVKFTRMRSRAEVEIGCVENENDVEAFVRDNGAGFDMRYENKLFGVFQRLHSSEEFEGTGIGLATVQRIVHRHGGTVRAEGAVDQGATFYFSLPKAPAAERIANAQ